MAITGIIRNNIYFISFGIILFIVLKVPYVIAAFNKSQSIDDSLKYQANYIKQAFKTVKAKPIESKTPKFIARYISGTSQFNSVNHELHLKPISLEELTSIVQDNVRLPPTVNIISKKFSDDFPNPTFTEVFFGSWQENGEIPIMPQSGSIIYNQIECYSFDKSAVELLHNNFIASLRETIGRGRFRVTLSLKTPGSINSAIVVSSKFVKLLRSKPMLVLYFILKLIGYSSIYETIWRFCGNRVLFYSNKHISAEKALRVPLGAFDNGQNTIYG